MSSTNEAFDGARKTLQRFVDANDRNDGDGMRACLTIHSIESGEFTGPQAGASFSLGDPTTEPGDGDPIPPGAVIIPIRIRPQGMAEDEAANMPAQELPAIMVQEHGEWKFDLTATHDRMMKAMERALGGAMDEIGSAMGQAMDGIAGAIQGAFGEADGQPSWNDVPDEPIESELHSIPEMATLERSQEEVSAALGFPVVVTADLRGLLFQANADDEELLREWLQDELLIAWPEMLEEASAGMSLEGRLRGIRIETATMPRDRFVASDMNDIVYRLNVQDESGYYSDEELEEVLPGILAGLPETPQSESGVRSVFPPAGGDITMESYVSLAAARCMKRISAMLGRDVALDADWNEIARLPDAAMLLLRWGLNRVVGGMALAMEDDESVADELRTNFQMIRLRCAFTPSHRNLTYAEGVLELMPALSFPENGCFWETDIAAALRGEIFEAIDEVSLTEALDGEVADAPDPAEEDDEAVTNETLFNDAIVGIEAAVPSWKMQIDMALGHDTPLKIDWASLGGRFELVQGMVHVGVVQSLNAIAMVGFNPATKESLAKAVRSVRIAHDAAAAAGSRVELNDGELLFRLNAAEEVTGPPDGTLADEVRQVVGTATSPAKGVPAPLTLERRNEVALAAMADLEREMRNVHLWPGDAPAERIEVRGAFGCENMAFEQWLAWVFIPRVKQIVAEGGAFPAGSHVAAYAVRAFDGANADDVIHVLYQFDQFIADLNR